MSRVRVLNLPSDCNEEQLRRHILNSLPPSAPHLEITDCVIKRSKSIYKGKSVIRMAFVGFRNATSGHFVVKHFDGTYFRSAKIRVEVAKGISEVGVTRNMQKKKEFLERKHGVVATKTAENRARNNDKNGNSNTNNSNNKNKTNINCTESNNGNIVRSEEEGKEVVNLAFKRSYGDRAQETRRNEKKEGLVEVNTEEDEYTRKKKMRKDEFVAGRTQATSGPTWTSEVLIPAVDTLLPVQDTSADGDDDCVDEEEAERRALVRQQALGKVSDLDFLASLTNKTCTVSGNSDANHGKKTNCADYNAQGYEGDKEEEEEDHRNENVNVGHILEEERQQQTENCHGKQEQLNVHFDASNEEAIVYESRRVRLGNIPFIATENDVKQFASSLVGPVEAVHIPLTKDTRQSKGAAFVKFKQVTDAVRALSLFNGAVFMGRLLRVSAAVDDPHSKKAEGVGPVAGNSEFKRHREQERRKADGSTLTWNTMYMNSHAAVESVARRLGVSSEAVVSVNARGAAVRAAIAEAYLTTEIQQVLGDEGIDLSLLESAQQNLLKLRSNTTILVKNIQATSFEDASELSKMFLHYGALEVTAFPSAGGFALFRYAHEQDARVAFQRLSYKLFKNAPLFLEWAPIGVIVNREDDEEKDLADRRREETKAKRTEGTNQNNSFYSEASEFDKTQCEQNLAFAPVLTLFISNIPFTSNEGEFYAFLLDSCPRLAAKSETDVERLVFEKEKGWAFLTLKEQKTFTYVQQRINGRSFAGRTLACVPSKETVAALEKHKTLRTTAQTDGFTSFSIAGSVNQGGNKTNINNNNNGTTSTITNNNNNNKDDDDDGVVKSSAVIATRRGGGHSGSKVPPGYDALKLVVKNVPFEATERDVRELFSAFSELRGVRLPRKSHHFSSHRENNHRGFAFVDFLSEEEARRAMETLKATHLYGRHLVLQYAKLDE